MSRPKNQNRRDKARRKKEADRYLISLARERRELWHLLNNAPLVRLKKPYQRGWVRFFKLTEEAKRRKDVLKLTKLLDFVQTVQYSHRRDFVDRKNCKGKRLRPRKHQLPTFSVRGTFHIKIPEDLLGYFVTHNKHPVSTIKRLRELIHSQYGGPIKVRYPQYFVSVIEPYMITHSRVALPEVERRLSEVEAFIDRGPNSGRLKNLQCSRSYEWKYIPEQQEDRKEIRALMRDVELDLHEYYMEHHSICQGGSSVLPPLEAFYTFVWITHTICR